MRKNGCVSIRRRLLSGRLGLGKVEPRSRRVFRARMSETAAGIYISPQLYRDARDRMWEVITHWHQTLNRGTVIMIWRDKAASGNIGSRVLGDTGKQICDVDGFLLTRIDKK